MLLEASFEAEIDPIIGVLAQNHQNPAFANTAERDAARLPKMRLLVSPLASLALLLPILAATQSTEPTPQPAPHIYEINPTLGAAGDKLTIIGFGFATSNTVHIGNLTIADVPIAWQAGITCIEKNSACHPGINQALVFTIPRGGAIGMHALTVENANGVSNMLMFTLTSAPG